MALNVAFSALCAGLLAPNATLKPQAGKRRRQDVSCYAEVESSDDDEEWTPLGEWRKRMKKQPKTSYGEIILFFDAV